MSAAEELRACADAVERCCSALVAAKAAALEECPRTLASAAERLQALGPGLSDSAGEADALAEAWRLRQSLRRAGALMANAAVYHGGWTSLLELRVAGYRADGLPADVTRAGQVWVQG